MKEWDEVTALFCGCCVVMAANGDGCECALYERDDVHPAGLMGEAPGQWCFGGDDDGHKGFRLFHTCEGCGTRLGGDRYEMIQLIERTA